MEAKLADALARLWGSDRPVPASNGAAVARALEQQYGLTLPESFSSYVEEAAPSSDWMDDGGVNWWPPERITSVANCPDLGGVPVSHPEIQAEAHKYLVLADYADWCGYGYAICCSDGPNRGHVALIGESPNRLITKSFYNFVALAAADSIRLHSPGGDGYSDPV